MKPSSLTRAGAPGLGGEAAGVAGTLIDSQSGWNVQFPARGSAGASSHPRGVRMSLRLSPFTSPAPMP